MMIIGVKISSVGSVGKHVIDSRCFDSHEILTYCRFSEWKIS